MRAPHEPAYPAALPRRLLTVPALFVTLAIVVALSPVLALLGGVVDGLRGDRGWPSVRLLGFAIGYLGCEAAGVVTAAWLWVSQPLARRGWADRNHRLQQWWVRSLMRAAGPILGLRLEIETLGPSGPGPLIAAARHVSVIDAVLPAQVLGVAQGRRLRYVLARGLRLDPCLDIVGHRLPNHFVIRDGPDAAAEMVALGRLVDDLGDHEAVVIFPEGGLFTTERRARSIDHLERVGSQRVDAARSLRNLLLPRKAGISALLRSAPDADVVIVGHRGFEPLGSLKVLWHSLPLTEPVRLRAERHPRSTIPGTEDERIRWLDERWAEMDRWLDTPED